MEYTYDDGGRAAAGYKGSTRDCVVRAIAIATGKPYREVYNEVNRLASSERRTKGRRSSARTGVRKETYDRYLKSLGWTWTPTMGIGTGCTVHLADGELPMGRLIVRVSKHLCAVLDGVVHDTRDPNNRGVTIYPPRAPDVPEGAEWLGNGNGWAYRPKRCVYGYWIKEGTR